MRYTIVALAAIAAATAALLALAQPGPSPSAPAPMERKLMPIDWDEVREAVRAQRLGRAQIRRMALAPDAPQPSLPMLLPMEQRIAAAQVHLFPQKDSYAASMRLDDITIEIHGERRALVLPENDPMLRVARSKDVATLAGAAVSFTIDRTEGGFDLTFSRFGAAYLISIECRNVDTDERCQKPDFIRAMAERMSLFGKDGP